ncbi:MAG: flagellar biosynthesis protein FliO [Thermoleophilia bacterium]|nr:flagellar biosynthesis protein FliO [Thermoleophilia bacterium]
MALLLVAGAPGIAGAATSTPATDTASKPAATAAAAKDEDKPSAAERRAANSEFEREKLDQGAFAEADKDAKDGDSGGSSGGGGILRSIFGLLVVLGVIYGVHWLLKRWGQSKLQGVSGTAGIIDVVATTSLAQGRALHLVRVGEELVLVGATEQSITRIGDFDASRLGAQMASQGDGSGFQAMLSGAMLGNQPGVPQGMGGSGSNRDPFLRRFLDNLRLSTAR